MIDSRAWLIYLNHTLSSIGDRLWGFGVGLYLLILYPKSLMMAAIYGVSSCLAIILFGSEIGHWIDRNPRLKVAITSLMMDNIFVVLGSTILSLNIMFKTEIEVIWSGNLQNLIFAAVIACAVLSSFGSVASNIAIERDWIVVLSDGNSLKLTELNSRMRSIDLTTNILAPLVMGQIITFGSPLVGTIFLGLWTLISLFVEYIVLNWIYSNVGGLAEKEVKVKSETSFGGWDMRQTTAAWRLYFTHQIRYVGIGFALLYITVMGFDSITYGYVYGQGGTESMIGIATGLGALVGISACGAFPYLKRKWGENIAGNIGFGWNVCLLILCVVSVFLPGSPFDPRAILHPFTSPNLKDHHVQKSVQRLWAENQDLFFFIFGVVISRFGLWVADLSVTQIMQENVIEAERGVINGVQNSLNKLVDLLKFLLVVILPSVEGFGYLIFFSWIVLLISWVCFNVYLNKSRKADEQFGRDGRKEQHQP